uniref:Uncharacterized protein n=1 Tax=viral metagenome TaxID=1070528 RepID=A0A6M3L614_9ZZZZ
MQHLRWTKTGRVFSKADEGKPNMFVFNSRTGQINVDLGNGRFAPYVWDPANNQVRYASYSYQFFDWYQVIRDKENNVLIDDQRFEVQYWQTQGGGRWRILDLYQTEVTTNQQDDHCIVTRRQFDGSGNELRVDFLFQPNYRIKLTFTLTVVNAGQYRIRFQNTGISGIPAERQNKQNQVTALLFDKVGFCWDSNEAVIHNYAIENTASGSKVDVFIGPFDLSAGGSVVVSPTEVTTGLDADGCSWATYFFSNVWFGYQDSNFPGWSFGLDGSIPSDATLTSAYFRARCLSSPQSTAYNSSLYIEDADPATNTVFSSSHLPGGITHIRYYPNVRTTALTADAWYFGSGDNNPTDIKAAIQDLVDKYGVLEVDDIINITYRTDGYSASSDAEFYKGTAELVIEYSAGISSLFINVADCVQAKAQPV